MRLLYQNADLLLDIWEELTFIDENYIRACDEFEIIADCVVYCVRQNTRNHLFVMG